MDEKNKEIFLTLTSSNSIIYNDNCIPDENEIKRELSLYNNELLNNIEINFDEIMKENMAISTLVLCKKDNPNLNVLNDIVTLIKSIDKYKNLPNKKILNDLKNYIEDLRLIDIKKKKLNFENKTFLTSSTDLKKEKEEDVFNRLYNKRKKFNIEIKSVRNNRSYSNNDRSDFFNRLYLNESCCKNKIPQNDCSKNFQIKSSIKSKMILYNKYKKQFENILDILYKEGKINYFDKLNYNEYILFMKKIGYLNYEDNEIEINMAKKIFEFLQLKDSFIPVKNLFIFTLSILNLHYFNSDENYRVSNKTYKSKSLSSTSSSSNISINKLSNHFKFNILTINSIQSKRIFTDYIILYYNWKKNNQNSYNNNNNKELFFNQNFTFKPVLNNEYNQRIKGNLFSRVSKFQNLKQINYDNLRKEKIKIETKECTFKPQITNYSFNFQRKPLFNNFSCKNKIQIKKNNSNISLIKNLKEYSFKPDLNLKNNENQLKTKEMSKNNSFKTIYDPKIFNCKNSHNSRNYSSLKDIQNYSFQKFEKNNTLQIRNNSINRLRKIRNNSLLKSINNSFKDLLQNSKYSSSKDFQNSKNISFNENEELIYKNKIYFKTCNFNNKIRQKSPKKDNLYHKKNISSPIFKKNTKINYYPIKQEKKLFSNKPLFMLDINLTNKNQKIYIYKGIDVDKIIYDFVQKNNIDDPKKVDFIKDLIKNELKKFN